VTDGGSGGEANYFYITRLHFIIGVCEISASHQILVYDLIGIHIAFNYYTLRTLRIAE
jgi:hypothetical protein